MRATRGRGRPAAARAVASERGIHTHAPPAARAIKVRGPVDAGVDAPPPAPAAVACTTTTMSATAAKTTDATVRIRESTSGGAPPSGSCPDGSLRLHDL